MIREISLDEPVKPSTQANPGVEVRGVLLPLQKTHLLLPNLTVVDVIGFREEDPVDNSPGWLRGSVNWNQRRIPVITCEYFVHEEVGEPGYRSRIALCHSLLDDQRMPFIGILCSSIPRLARINDSSMQEVRVQEIMPEMMLKHVKYNAEDAWIPDIEKLSQACLDLMT